MAYHPIFVKQSDLPLPLERFRRKNKDSDPRFANVTRLSNGQYVSFSQSGRRVLDVFVWSINRKDAIEAAEHSATFFRRGYPKGRTPVIVELGQ